MHSATATLGPTLRHAGCARICWAWVGGRSLARPVVKRRAGAASTSGPRCIIHSNGRSVNSPSTTSTRRSTRLAVQCERKPRPMHLQAGPYSRYSTRQHACPLPSMVIGLDFPARLVGLKEERFVDITPRQRHGKPPSPETKGAPKILLVELRGLEPLTFSMPLRRAPSCATAPRYLFPSAIQALFKRQLPGFVQEVRAQCARLLRTKPKLAGGAEGIRTPDLYSAIVALSQLSYSPPRHLRAIV
jgi:hypothetical protein